MKLHLLICCAAIAQGLFCPALRATEPLDTWHWRNPLPRLASLNAVRQGGGLLVAVGSRGAIVTSPDGRNWLDRPSGTEMELRSVCYGAGQYQSGFYRAKLVP